MLEFVGAVCISATGQERAEFLAVLHLIQGHRVGDVSLHGRPGVLPHPVDVVVARLP